MLKWLLASLLVLCLGLPYSAAGYSVLTHQANIDSTWEKCIVPLLQKRYPGADSAQLLEAKSYAYGGAIIQDMGYYPFGSKLFTNLTHYVRSGDFVRNMLSEARGRNQYAFALGALGHYAADNSGHPEGTNKAMPLVYKDLQARFGNSITYEEAPAQHTQLEFAFDVVQLASGKYRSEDYHKYVGFHVSKDLLERAFEKTYGLKLGEVVANVDLSISSYRFAVSSLIPTAARAAWHSKRKEIQQLSPGARRRDYLRRTNRRQYEQEFGDAYQRPGFGARILSYFIRVLPKIGPLRPFAFHLPTPEAQQIFRGSFRQVMSRYCVALAQEPTDTTRTGPTLANTDFDTGHNTKAGEYALADETYGEWLRDLSKDKFARVTPQVRQNILAFYGDAPKPPRDEEEKEADKRRETQQALTTLRTLSAQE